MPKCYGYARASTEEQETTLTGQAHTLQKEFDHAYTAGFEWGGVFTDRGVSGNKPLRNRPEGHKLNMALEEGDCVIFTKLDRGFRNTMDLLEVLKSWQARKIRVVLMDCRVDTGTPIGMMLVTIIACVAEFERALMIERRKAFIAERKRLGKPFQGQPPYGFKIVGPKGNRYFAPDPQVRAFGKKLLEWHEAGWGREAICLHLFKHKIKNSAGREWTTTAIDDAIKGERLLQAKEKAEAEAKEKKNGMPNV